MRLRPLPLASERDMCAKGFPVIVLSHIVKTQTNLLSQRIEAVRLRQACPQNLLTAENAQT
ncbi:hypothetical protein I380019A4_19090 [Sutterella wadsworthensis]